MGSRDSMTGVCVYSNCCNDVPQVAQLYGTNATHTWHCASILVFVEFAGFDKADATADIQ